MATRWTWIWATSAALAASPLACGGDDTAGAAGGDAAADGATGDAGAHVDGSTGPDGASDASADAPSDAHVAFDAPAGSLAAMCNGTLGALTRAFEACCSASDRTTDVYKLYDGLLQLITAECESQLPASLAAGRVTYDASAAQSCIAAYQTLIGGGVCWDKANTNGGGNDGVFTAAACTGVVAGKQSASQPCRDDYECQNGLACVGFTGTSDGQCVAMPGIGQPCGAGVADGGAGSLHFDWGFGSHPACAAGAYCGSTRTCVAQVGAGGSCFEDKQCTAGLVCHVGACGNATPAPVGGACVASADCQNGLYCAPTDGGATGKCATKEAAGGACRSSFSNECKGACIVPDGGASGTCAAFCGAQ